MNENIAKLKSKGHRRYSEPAIRPYVHYGFGDKGCTVRWSSFFRRYICIYLGRFVITNETFVYDFPTSKWTKINFKQEFVPSERAAHAAAMVS